MKAEKNKTDANNNNLEFIKTTVEGWLKTMRNVIDDRQKPDEEINDERVGLRNEMDYWKHRYYKLNSIDEQLSSPANRLIYNMLEFFITLSSSLSQDSSSSKHKQLERIQKQIQTYKPDYESKQKDYKELENELNRYLTEAKNNDKYLMQLERYVEKLEQARPSVVREQLPLLLYSIRMIYNIDKYYLNKKNILKLFRKLTNQMITCCKLFINSKTKNCTNFWNFEPIENLIEVFRECIGLHSAYHDEFKRNAGDNEMRNNAHFDFLEEDINSIFAYFDSFKRKLTKFIEVFLIKKQINTLYYYDFDEQNIDALESKVSQFENKINEEILKINDPEFDKN